MARSFGRIATPRQAAFPSRPDQRCAARDRRAAAYAGLPPRASHNRQVTLLQESRMDISALTQAVQTLNAEDAFRVRFNADQWLVLAGYFSRHEIRTGDLLIQQGDRDRNMYLLEQGNLQVFVNRGAPGSHRIAILRPGSVVGEPALFGEGPRMANVEAMTPCVVWALGGPRLDELGVRSPALALEVLRGAGAVMAIRMRANIERNIPVS
jgi:CRP-like cAMP-binding protein